VPALVFLLLLVTGVAAAQEKQSSDVQHWALAPFLGTGAYQFDEQETVYVLKYEPRWLLREGSDAGQLSRRARIELGVPAAFGLSNFDLANLPDTLDPDNVATLSVVPGIIGTLEMNPRWTLRGNANLGLGTRLDGNESALIYRAGIRSRYRLDSASARWNLIAALDYIGYDTNQHRHGHLLPLMRAGELELPVNAWATEHGPPPLVTHLAASHYLDELSLSALDDARASISNDIEIGFAVRPSQPFRLWRLSWERVGIAYRRGDGSDPGDEDTRFEGIRLYFASVFDQ
jgi:hypothetical protein